MKTTAQLESNRKYYKTAKGKAAKARGAASPKGRFAKQKVHAKRRGVSFEFTFDEWWAMWEPHWEHRGRTKGSMVMCRVGDVGPYSPSNCFIDFHVTNCRDGMKLVRKKQLKAKLEEV